IWESAAYRRAGSSFAFARGNGADFKEQAGRQSDSTRAGTYARDARGLRLAVNDLKMKPAARAGTSMWCRRSEPSPANRSTQCSLVTTDLASRAKSRSRRYL